MQNTPKYALKTIYALKNEAQMSNEGYLVFNVFMSSKPTTNRVRACPVAFMCLCVMTHPSSSASPPLLPPVTSGSGSSHQHHSAQWGIRRIQREGGKGSGAASSTARTEERSKTGSPRIFCISIHQSSYSFFPPSFSYSSPLLPWL